MRVRPTFAAAAFSLALLPALAADGPQPGLWKVTVKTESAFAGVTAPDNVSTRCLKPEQLIDLEKTFTPEVGAACTRVDYEWTGKKLSWRIKCTAPVAMDNSGWYEFDTPRHYVGELTVRMAAPRAQDMVARTRIEGERIGDCPN
jgi:hypothetical protein